VAGVINSGHFDLVEDICWEPDSQFLLSTSKDQTTRFHSYWKNDSDKVTWHEFGRPQIHGYDLQCVALLERFKFVSGADEKLLRIFESPKIFLQNLYNLNKDESLVKLIKVTNISQNKLSFNELIIYIKRNQLNWEQAYQPWVYLIKLSLKK